MERVSSKRKRRKEELSTVWVIPRAVLDIKQCDLEQQRALIAYNLLFNGPLILVDSDYISNLNLRAAVRNGNQFFCRLFEERLVRLAIREEGKGEPTSLAKTSEMIAGRKGGLSDGTPTGDAPEFTWVERKTMPVTFSLSRAEQRYQEEILRIFCDTKFRDDDLPLTYAETLREILEERVASGGRISGSLFGPQSELWLIMEQRLNESGIRERVGQFVFDVARGPYVTFLPDSLGLSATYSQEDKIGIDLFRRRYVLAEEQLKKRTLSLRRPSLAQTVA